MRGLFAIAVGIAIGLSIAVVIAAGESPPATTPRAQGG